MNDGYIFNLGGGVSFGVPVGCIISMMGLDAPDGYLVCDGAEYAVEDYPELAEYFAEQFGTANKFGGDGSATFAVPDLRGEFLRGSGLNSRAKQGSGAAPGQHQDATTHLLTHAAKGFDFCVIRNTPSDNVIVAPGNQDVAAYLPSGINFSGRGMRLAGESYAYTSGTPNQLLFTSRPTNTAVLFCIKY